MKQYLVTGLAIVGWLFFLGSAQAGISLNETRIVLFESKKEASILVMNQEPEPIMIQSWIEGAAAEQDVPFAITPALSQLDGHAQKSLRILYQGQGLPADRESLLRLNVQEVPRKSSSENALQIAVRQRIKLFYRPVSLKGSANEAPTQLQWHVLLKDGKPVLEVRNDSEFHVSFGEVNVRSGSRNYPAPAEMIPPHSSQSFVIEGASSSVREIATKVEFESIDDHGTLVRHSSGVSI